MSASSFPTTRPVSAVPDRAKQRWGPQTPCLTSEPAIEVGIATPGASSGALTSSQTVAGRVPAEGYQ